MNAPPSDDDLVVTPTVSIPARDLSWTAARSGGPGGQHVNKTSTKVDLRFDLPGTAALTETVKHRLRALAGARMDAAGRVVLTASSSRSQSANLDDARMRLANLIRAALVVPKRRRKTKPSKGAVRRRLEGKRQQSEKKAARRRPDS